MDPLVAFYSKLPKGAAPASGFGGVKARFFNGKNASSVPLWGTIISVFLLGYTIDYQSASLLPLLIYFIPDMFIHSAPE